MYILVIGQCTVTSATMSLEWVLGLPVPLEEGAIGGGTNIY